MRIIRIIVSMAGKIDKIDPLVQLADRWAKSIGRRKAMGRLLSRNVAGGTAEKICYGRYPSTPREILAEILKEELEKDGFAIVEAS
jgi:hypothetical protein